MEKIHQIVINYIELTINFRLVVPYNVYTYRTHRADNSGTKNKNKSSFIYTIYIHIYV